MKRRTTIRKATLRIIGSWVASHRGNTLDLVGIYLRIESPKGDHAEAKKHADRIGSLINRILATLHYELQRRTLKRRIAALCFGGGNAVALAVERY